MLRRFWRNKIKRHDRDHVPDKHHQEPPEKRARPNRSANDFLDKDELRLALISLDQKGSFCESEMKRFFFSSSAEDPPGEDSSSYENSTDIMKKLDNSLDWVLENYDPNTTQQQSIEKELRRLLVLKSYLVLDTQRRQVFDQITDEASKAFRCPMAMISLVDLGRQWFLSKQGLDAPETPRKVAFCAHGIQSSLDCFVVPNATQDARFQYNPLVTEAPHVRFYAGAPLISPEGERLGMLCVVHTEPRPEGLNEEERTYLKKLSARAVQAMVEHRQMKSNWFHNLVQTSFPQIMELEQVGEEEEDEADDNENKYNNSDPDIVDFLKATSEMSLKDVVSSLEKQLEDQHITDSKKYLNSIAAVAERKKPRPKKSVHFALDRRGRVQKQVHEIESWKEYKDAWWSDEEMYEIRLDALRVVKYYVKHRPTYIMMIETVARGSQPQEAEDLIMKKVATDHGFARGLEPNIVSLFKETRKAARKAVLQEQFECLHQPNSNFDLTSDCLREESLIYSQMLTRYAQRTAIGDHLEALAEMRLSNRWNNSCPAA